MARMSEMVVEFLIWVKYLSFSERVDFLVLATFEQPSGRKVLQADPFL